MNMSLVGRGVQTFGASLRQLAQLLLERDGAYAQAFENLILALIVLSLVSVGLETLSGLPAWATMVLKVGEIVIVAVFSFEYLLRIVAAPHKLAFIFSFYGLVDLLAIAPFYLAGLDVRYVRALRVLRVLRVLKLQRRVLENTVATVAIEAVPPGAVRFGEAGLLRAIRDEEIEQAVAIVVERCQPSGHGFDLVFGRCGAVMEDDVDARARGNVLETDGRRRGGRLEPSGERQECGRASHAARVFQGRLQAVLRVCRGRLWEGRIRRPWR